MGTNQKACQNKRYYVTSDHQPIVCPPLEEAIFDAHPRVYLTLNEEGHVLCPYCGTEFILKESQHGK